MTTTTATTPRTEAHVWVTWHDPLANRDKVARITEAVRAAAVTNLTQAGFTTVRVFVTVTGCSIPGATVYAIGRPKHEELPLADALVAHLSGLIVA